MKNTDIINITIPPFLQSTRPLSRAHCGDAGLDIAATKGVTLQPGQTEKIHTGLCVGIPLGFVGDLRPRSSWSSRGVLVHLGTIDHGYTAEILVVATNLSQRPIDIAAGDHIAQLVVLPCYTGDATVVESITRSGTRGNQGFGSSGR